MFMKKWKKTESWSAYLESKCDKNGIRVRKNKSFWKCNSRSHYKQKESDKEVEPIVAEERKDKNKCHKPVE